MARIRGPGDEGEGRQWNKGLQSWGTPSRLTKPRPVDPDQGGVALDPVYSVPPPYLAPPPQSAVRFNVCTNDQAVAAGVQQRAIVFSPLIQWTQNFLAVLNYWEIGVQNQVSGLDVFFTVKYNNGPVPGMDKLRTQAGPAGIAIEYDYVNAVFQQAGGLTMTVTNNSVVAVTVNARLVGWTWSTSDAIQQASDVAFPRR